MVRTHRFLLLLILVLPGSLLYGSDFTINEENSDFFNLTEISLEEWEKAVPAAVREGRAPEYLYKSSLHTSRLFHGRVFNGGKGLFWYIEFLDQLELVELHSYSPERDDWKSSYSGDQVPMNDRALPHNRLLLPLEIESGESLDLYLRVQDYQFKRSKIRIINPGRLLKEFGGSEVIDLFVFALIIFMTLYIAFRFYTGRQYYYIFYAIVMLFLIITLLGKYRYLSYLITPGTAYGYFVYIFFNSAAIISALLFAVSFFHIRIKSRLFYLISILSAGLAGIAVISFFVPEPRLGDVMNFLILPSLMLILFVSIKSSITGDKASRMIVLSFIPIILGAVTDNLLMYLRISSISFPNRMILIGSAVHIFIINYGMILRQADREREYRMLKTQFSSRLEESVQERTRKLEIDASMDPLTGVLNRAGMQKHIAELEASAVNSIGVLFCDMDNFKYFNDTYGHNTGDRILCETAAFFKTHLRSQDLIFRYGGDEFLIFLPDTPPGQAESLGIRFHHEFQKFAEGIDAGLKNSENQLGLSLGVAEWTPGQSLPDIINSADKSMMKAKADGKNRLRMSGKE